VSTSSASAPTDELERDLAAHVPTSDVVVVGVDEVGRGALAGPVAVGACAIRIREGQVVSPLPEGVRDSKKLSPRRREALEPQIREAAWAQGIGWASAAEIDEHGIVRGLELASARALGEVARSTRIDAVLMDGNADVISPVLEGLLDPLPRVRVRVRADRDCVSVAAASVLAKVSRDAHMVALDELAPVYGWAGNKGYGSAAHRTAIAEHGAHPEHRHSWNLLGARR
jgi:ribonuclease HII